MRASQGLAWLLVAGLSIPAGDGRQDAPPPGNTPSWGDEEVDEIEVVKAFKFADYTGVSVAPLDTSKAPPGEGKEAKNVQQAIAGVDESFLTGVKKGVSSYSKTAVEPGAGSGHALLIKGAVVDLNPGSKGARVRGSGSARARRAPSSRARWWRRTRARSSSASPTRSGRDRAWASAAAIPRS